MDQEIFDKLYQYLKGKKAQPQPQQLPLQDRLLRVIREFSMITFDLNHFDIIDEYKDLWGDAMTAAVEVEILKDATCDPSKT